MKAFAWTSSARRIQGAHRRRRLKNRAQTGVQKQGLAPHSVSGAVPLPYAALLCFPSMLPTLAASEDHRQTGRPLPIHHQITMRIARAGAYLFESYDSYDGAHGNYDIDSWARHPH